MLKELLHKYALKHDKTLIKAIDADKNGEYFCPSCNDNFILKKSGKTGKGSRRPHFSHNNLSSNCTHESYLHNTFKIKAIEILNEYIMKNIPLNITWNCIKCKQEHNFNFTGISEALPEFHMKERIPDIALLNNSKIVCMVIEIVYKHPPEEAAIKYYIENNILLIQINIFSENDLENVENKIKNPEIVYYCSIPNIQQVPVRLPTQIIRKPSGVSNDFLDNPQKYYSKNGNIYRKNNWKNRRKY